MRRHVVRAAGVVLLCAASACGTWRARQGPVPRVIAEPGPGRVRLYRGDGSMLEMRYAHIVGDSIVGEGGRPSRRVAISTAEVSRVDTRGVDALRTAALTAGVILAAAAAVLLAVLSVMNDPHY
jgi:hypothetical protein